MKRRRQSFLALIAAMFAVASAVPAPALPVLSVFPSLEKVHVGQDFVVDIVISGLEGDLALGAFDFTFEYDPLLLTFNTLGFGNQLDLMGLGTVSDFSSNPDPALGLVNLFEISLDSVASLQTLQLDSFLLARLSFTGLNSGISDLDFAALTLSDPFGSMLSASVIPATVEVAAPTTIALLTIGLATIVLAPRLAPGLSALQVVDPDKTT